MNKIVVLSGAGISAESGIPTFRGSGGLWEGHDIREVASPEGWRSNPQLVLDFYNKRRKNAREVKPNPGHLALVELEQHFDVQIITQNIDNLHEQAGSQNILHLHGELFKSQSTADPNLVYEIDGWELNWGDTCERGSQLRPHIVWFGEMVPMIEPAMEMSSQADVFIVVGTSLEVYPAAGLIEYVPPLAEIYIVDPGTPRLSPSRNIEFISEKASVGLPLLVEKLTKNNS